MSNADIRGRFIWHELMTTDTEAAADFYSKVVPWKARDSGMPSYSLWMAGKTQVGGLTAPDRTDAGTPPLWIVYIATPDVDATVVEASRLGGKVLKSATDIPNVGRYAVLADPQGATFAVYMPAGPAPEGSANRSGGAGEFTWHELATTDYAAALSFYVALFGWEKGTAHDMGAMGIYQIINQHGAQVGGIYSLPAPSTPPHWLSYVRVPDCARATAAAKAAGGRVLHGPTVVPGGSWITMLMDPQGGAFAVIEPPKVAAQKKPAAKTDAANAKLEKPKAARKGPKKSGGKNAAGRKPAAVKKTTAKKTAGRRAAKVAKKAAKKRPAAKRAAAKGTGAKRGKSAAKKGGAPGKRAGGKKAKRR
ncbi:MAG: VOC family protein [Steroidobacteraceae bacterium]